MLAQIRRKKLKNTLDSYAASWCKLFSNTGKEAIFVMTVKQVRDLTGVSVRALQYYDSIGLLPPAQVTEAGYRLYDASSLERLQQILLFRELGFPLKEIAAILQAPDFDREKALRQQIELLEMRKQHLENLLAFARGIQQTGAQPMNFDAFDTAKQKQYKQQAKAQWGDTAAYRAYERKSAARTAETENALGAGLMSLFAEFGSIRTLPADHPAAHALVRRLQSYITHNFYPCTDEILLSLGEMYAADAAFTANIDAAGGAGTAQFVADAIFATVAQ